MRYLLLLYSSAEPASGAAEDGAGQVQPEPSWLPWTQEVRGRGIVPHGGARLREAGVATTVRTRHGEVLLGDGPFAETKEQIVGYEVIECADLDEAIEAASRHPVAEEGTVEVRPVLENP
jgi:hypothetical protein